MIVSLLRIGLGLGPWHVLATRFAERQTFDYVAKEDAHFATWEAYGV